MAVTADRLIKARGSYRTKNVAIRGYNRSDGRVRWSLALSISDTGLVASAAPIETAYGDLRAAEQAASVRFDLERMGTIIGPLDTLTAGTALAYGATLVTHNIEEFSRIPGLRLEDWY